jgi:hypothetical protein
MTLSIDRPVEAAQPRIARPYTLTGGRTRPTVALPLEAAIETLANASRTEWAPGDVRADIVGLCRRSPSVAEIAAIINLPLGVARVLVSDLVASSHLRVHGTLSARSTVTERRELIERTLSGLRAL